MNEMTGLSPSFLGLEELQRIYSEIDEQIAVFKRISRLDCPRRCLKCCESAKFVEVSVLEMIPLSLHLWQTGKAEFILKKVSEVDMKSQCVLLNRNLAGQSQWGCGFFSWRPLVCRLFGFSAVLDKHGRPRIALCKPMKDLHPGVEVRVHERIKNGLGVPVISTSSRKVAMLNPYLGPQRYPLHEGLRKAIEIAGHRMALRDTPEG